MNSANIAAGILFEAHHRAGLVERAARADHLVHQAGLGAGEDVADLALLLRGGAQRVLHRAAVEALDGLELVERHHDGALPLGRKPPGQRKNLVGQPVDVALGLHGGKRDGELADPAIARLEAQLRPRRGNGFGQPRPRPLPPRLHRRERARIPFQERDVRAVAADRQVDRQRTLPRERAQRLPARATTCRTGAARSGRPSAPPTGPRPAGRARRPGPRTPRRGTISP